MTINASRTRELDIETIVYRAHQLAGLVAAGESVSSPTYLAKQAMGLDFLDVILKSLQSSAAISMHIVRSSVAVTAGDATKALSTSALSALGDGMWKETGDTVETVVVQKDLETYHQISDKTTTGQPQLFYVQKAATGLTVYFWPIPSTDGTFYYKEHRLVADGNVSAYTLELERHWVKHIMWELAHYLGTASSLPGEVVNRLATNAAAAKEEAKQYSKYVPSFQAILRAPTGWS